MSVKTYDSEKELEDCYPIYPGYLYIACYDNGQQNVYKNKTIVDDVHDLKLLLGAVKIKNCDIARRNLWDRMV
jgi:hypothetical protein